MIKAKVIARVDSGHKCFAVIGEESGIIIREFLHRQDAVSFLESLQKNKNGGTEQ